MSKLRRIAALGLTAVLLGGCVPQKVAAPEKAEETKAEEAKTEESQAKNEAKNEGTNETAAEAETAAAIATEITGPVEITIWHQYSDQYEVWFQKVADEFHAKNPDITVKLQYQPADQYEAKVMAAAKADDLPSMVHSAAANMTSYINEGALVNMDDYIYDSTVGYENFDEDINSGLNQMYVPWGNKRYAMPLFLGGNVFFYNKTMFEELGIEPPKTWSEVEAVATAVSDKIGKPGFGFQIMVDGYMEVLTQAGGEVIDLENKTIGFDSETAREKITWYYGYLATAVGDKFELGAAPLPQEGPKKFVSLSEPVFAIAKTNPEEELASWKFLKYLLSPEVNAESGTVFGALPASTAAMNESVYQDFLKVNPVAAAVYEQRDSYGYMPTIAGWYELRTSLDKALEEIMLDISDMDTALAEARKSAEAAIRK